MERKLLDYLPPVLKEAREMRAIMEAEQPEAEACWDALQRTLNNLFVRTGDEAGLARWERLLAIRPKGRETLDERKLHVLARLNERLPYTIRALRGMLSNLCGDRFLAAEVYPDEYRLEVEIEAGAQALFSLVRELLERVVPANLSWTVFSKQETRMPEAIARVGGAVLTAFSVTALPPLLQEHRFDTTVRAGARMWSVLHTALPALPADGQ